MDTFKVIDQLYREFTATNIQAHIDKLQARYDNNEISRVYLDDQIGTLRRHERFVIAKLDRLMAIV